MNIQMFEDMLKLREALIFSSKIPATESTSDFELNVKIKPVYKTHL